jgi:hypothetical protein
MERHPGAPFMISVRGVRRSGASFGILSHADKKSPAAIEAFAITIRDGRDSPNAAARLVARIEPRLGGEVLNVIELHPGAIKRYIEAVEDLAKASRRRTELATVVRELVERVTVSPTESGKAPKVEALGRLEGLLGLASGHMAGKMVAGGGLEPPTSGL